MIIIILVMIIVLAIVVVFIIIVLALLVIVIVMLAVVVLRVLCAILRVGFIFIGNRFIIVLLFSIFFNNLLLLRFLFLLFLLRVLLLIDEFVEIINFFRVNWNIRKNLIFPFFRDLIPESMHNAHNGKLRWPKLAAVKFLH